jgi:hypothetical protein
MRFLLLGRFPLVAVSQIYFFIIVDRDHVKDK